MTEFLKQLDRALDEINRPMGPSMRTILWQTAKQLAGRLRGKRP